MDVAAIERFSGPPLAERAWISEQARACVVRPGTDDLDTLAQRGAPSGIELAWDAWRREDGRWTVVAAAGDAEAPASTWIYDPRSRSVHPEDAASHRLASEDVVVPLRPTTSTVTLAREDARSAAPGDDDRDVVAGDDHGSVADDALIADDELVRRDEAPPRAEPSDPDASEPEEPATGRSKSRKGRRASVPRWDEILFGAGQNDA